MAAATRQRLVLVADDDVVIRNLIRRSLEGAGFRVLAAADGSEALALSRACPEHIDALVTDVDMPHMDGVTLAHHIAQERTNMSVVVMSGGTMRIIPEQLAFVSKPFLPAELIAKLEDVLASRQRSCHIPREEDRPK